MFVSSSSSSIGVTVEYRPTSRAIIPHPGGRLQHCEHSDFRNDRRRNSPGSGRLDASSYDPLVPNAGLIRDAAPINPQAQADSVHVFLHCTSHDRLVLNLACPDHSLTDQTCLLSGRPPDPHLPGRRGEGPLLEPLADFLIERRHSLVSGIGALGRFHRHGLLARVLELAAAEGHGRNAGLIEYPSGSTSSRDSGASRTKNPATT